jgi:hypothetical protein
MADTDLVTVVLDASTAEDIQARIDRVPPGQWRLRKAIRMCTLPTHSLPSYCRTTSVKTRL